MESVNMYRYIINFHRVSLVARFWAGPIVILVAMKAMQLWVREKVVNGVELAVTFLGLNFFLVRAARCRLGHA